MINSGLKTVVLDDAVRRGRCPSVELNLLFEDKDERMESLQLIGLKISFEPGRYQLRSYRHWTGKVAQRYP